MSEPSVARLLFAFLGAPVLWAIHLGASYFLVTLDCATAWDGAAWAVAAATALCAAASIGAGRTAWRLRRPTPAAESDPDERGWIGFLGVAGVGGSVLFTAVIVLEGMAPYMVGMCG